MLNPPLTNKAIVTELIGKLKEVRKLEVLLSNGSVKGFISRNYKLLMKTERQNLRLKIGIKMLSLDFLKDFWELLWTHVYLLFPAIGLATNCRLSLLETVLPIVIGIRQYWFTYTHTSISPSIFFYHLETAGNTSRLMRFPAKWGN